MVQGPEEEGRFYRPRQPQLSPFYQLVCHAEALGKRACPTELLAKAGGARRGVRIGLSKKSRTAEGESFVYMPLKSWPTHLCGRVSGEDSAWGGPRGPPQAES